MLGLWHTDQGADPRIDGIAFLPGLWHTDLYRLVVRLRCYATPLMTRISLLFLQKAISPQVCGPQTLDPIHN